MSGILAVAALDGRPVNRAEIDHLCDIAPFRGRDGRGVWVDGPIGLGHLAFHTLRCSEPQPATADDGDYAIVLDGRIDNRDELLAQLGISHPGPGDACLALGAYRRWSADAPLKILGDFAFIVWDRPRRRLFCARDPLGIRPLYYHHSSRLFVCASDLAQVLAAPDVPRAPHDGMIGEYLANAIVDRSETVYAGILRVPPGHTLEVPLDGAPKTRCYWAMDTTRELRYRSDDEYAQHFAELFERATSSRLRSAVPVGVYLSGGTDSSAVAAMACRLTAPSERPSLFTLAFEESDETQYVRDLAELWNAPSHVTHIADAPRVDPSVRWRDPHDCLRDAAVVEWKRGIAARGHRAMLTGQGGDYGFYGSTYSCADLLRRGRLVAFCRLCRSVAADPDNRWAATDAVRYGVWPLLPTRLRNILRPFARRIADVARVPEWIDPRFAARTGLEHRLRPAAPPPGPSAARDDVRAAYESGWTSVYLESSERESAELGLEDRHPLFDRRVVEFALALPDDQRWRDGVTRFVVRRAMADSLPPSVRSRRTRGSGSSRLVRAVEALGRAGVFAGLAIADAGWVRQGAVDAMYRCMQARFARGDAAYNDDAFPLWIIGGVELWFRQTFGKRL
jgi:asparagine synthase (glutamine-hydrolysing)